MPTPLEFPHERITRTRVEDVALPGDRVLALLTLDNGTAGAKPATLGPGGLRELGAALDQVAARVDTGEVVAVAITGTGAYLAAGADLRVVAALTGHDQARQVAELGHAVLGRLGELGVPSFAFLNGAALGGGLEIALNCHYRTVAADVKALALPETHLGLVPGWGGCTLLPGIVGMENALELVLGRPLSGNRTTDAATASQMGLVDAVLDREGFLEASIAWAVAVLDGQLEVARPSPTGDRDHALVERWRDRLDGTIHGSRPAPYRALDLLARAGSSSRRDGFAAEDDALTELLVSPEARASLYAFDLVNRGAPAPPDLPTGQAAPAPTKVGLVGAGLMAGQLAVLVARRTGARVTMREVDDARVAAGWEHVRGLVRGMTDKGRMSGAEADRVLGAISISTDVQDLTGADLVVEAVTEVMAVKRAVLADVEAVVASGTVLATNTSALSVGSMRQGLAHPGRVVGLHFFNPVAQMRLVEVVRPDGADPSAVATALATARALGKIPVVVADRPGFVVNRLLLRMLADVAASVQDGAPVGVADRALRPLGLPMGPFALLQLVGLPVALHVLQTLHDELGPRFHLSPALRRLADASASLVDRDGVVLASVQDAFGAPGTSDEEQVRDRVVQGLAEEVGLMLDEGVVAGPQEIDLCMVLGAGWPLHLGGVTPYLDRTGTSAHVTGRAFAGDRWGSVG
ncbi:3-hydroxyacyl-CoA dehydrogenase NAD-binding domain-containing protein [Cellulomonas bogoriensis]|uniref:3-hydroxyacyl-CoA dehydrogenase n=1 Tax=Cellulomonas bogoriensis 69B4 = DSM 16987 TaxID=1386082 RepID=A0A0A0C2U3_9CELL|nr:3-hydroxyacyl-CoA dehydrogenase NAD-binding domain-containing protein [Cellulomonas bogoriensis]KGM14297.1 3-hydroxyacyl-CoA dehydrogenase [Cellulomonas bogoriensis 69B4 = DSM 16987]